MERTRELLGDVGVLVDLVSHDILNNNQAVLTYLELIGSAPGADENVRGLAAKAASRIRNSSMRLDGMKRLGGISKRDPISRQPVPARDVIDEVGQDLSGMFFDRRVVVDTSGVDPQARVRGGRYVRDLFGNMLGNIVQLDRGREVTVKVSSSPVKRGGTECWRFTVKAPGATLPQGTESSVIQATRSADISKLAGVSGLMCSDGVARALGGRVTWKASGRAKDRGCVCEATLERGEP